MARSFRIIGRGRAGGAFELALAAAQGWQAAPALGRGDDLRSAALGVDAVVIATPDRAIATVAAAIAPVADTVVLHLSGATGLDALHPHPRRAAVHPLMTLPDPERGAARLRGSWFAIAGDPLAGEIVTALDGRGFPLAEQARPVYHAAACVASNHVTVLLAQVERLAAAAGVPFAAFFDLVRATVDNCEELGPLRALTGPAARGDDATVTGHIAAIDRSEHRVYRAMVDEIRRIAQ